MHFSVPPAAELYHIHHCRAVFSGCEVVILVVEKHSTASYCLDRELPVFRTVRLAFVDFLDPCTHSADDLNHIHRCRGVVSDCEVVILSIYTDPSAPCRLDCRDVRLPVVLSPRTLPGTELDYTHPGCDVFFDCEVVIPSVSTDSNASYHPDCRNVRSSLVHSLDPHIHSADELNHIQR